MHMDYPYEINNIIYLYFSLSSLNATLYPYGRGVILSSGWS
jgi:hypothetical protein